MKYLLVDSLNMFMRAKHVGGRGADIDTKIGMAMHIMFNSLAKCPENQMQTYCIVFRR